MALPVPLADTVLQAEGVPELEREVVEEPEGVEDLVAQALREAVGLAELDRVAEPEGLAEEHRPLPGGALVPALQAVQAELPAPAKVLAGH